MLSLERGMSTVSYNYSDFRKGIAYNTAADRIEALPYQITRWEQLISIPRCGPSVQTSVRVFLNQ